MLDQINTIATGTLDSISVLFASITLRPICSARLVYKQQTVVNLFLTVSDNYHCVCLTCVLDT